MNKHLLLVASLLVIATQITASWEISYAASPSAKIISIADETNAVPDSRVKVLTEYLKQYNSPLSPYAQILVEEADKNNIDWKLLTAIAGLESTFAQQIPSNSYNAWGWGIYGDQTKYFNSWEEAIGTISKGLRENYINKLKTDDVYAIGRLYATSPTWAVRVEHLMNDIDRFSNSKPVYSLSLSI